MRITIDPRTANRPEAHKWLDRILHRVEDGWHVWEVKDARSIAALKVTSWVSARGQQGLGIRDLLDKAIVGTAWRSPLHGRSLRVTQNPAQDGDLAPEEALRFIDEPVIILVENRYSDGSFVRRIVAETDSSLNRLWHRPGEPIRIDSVGGAGQMSTEVLRRVRGAPCRPRIVAITDSGRRHPEDTESSDAKRLQTECSKYGVPCWVLAKREAENYLPGILLDEHPGAGGRHALLVDTWNRLSDDQKDFIDMKHGLRTDRPESSRGLFGNLSLTERRIFDEGFGPMVYKCWSIWTVQAARQILERGQDDLKYGTLTIRREV